MKFERMNQWFGPEKDGGGTPEPDKTENKGGEEKKFSQADVDRIVTERLQREQEKSRKTAEEAKQKAEAEAAAKNGEWQKLAEARAQELAKAQAETRAANIRMAAVRAGLKDPEYGVYLVSRAGADADPEKVLGEWLKENPEGALTPNPSPQGGRGEGNGSATNPAGNSAYFTREQLRDPGFFQANKAAILAAMREGRIKEN